MYTCFFFILLKKESVSVTILEVYNDAMIKIKAGGRIKNGFTPSEDLKPDCCFYHL